MNKDARKTEATASAALETRLALGELEPEQEDGDFAHAFRIGDWWFLTPTDLPTEVSPPLHCARLPFTATWCLGLANHRGELIPIYDIRALMAEPTRQLGGYFLMVGRRDARAGLRIDEIRSCRIPADATFQPLFPIPNLPELEVTGISLDGTVFARIDLDALFATLAQRASMLDGGQPSA
ncbi:chemotaxis protein CheW [Thiocystis violacea]|uniref:chemotaxis protein CheW n=1 Tax=Thiocystis violacea TaxID=13725 RepID=UPI001908A3D8|nr:chemotaxis protein CheW [Thiocystis violacea]MBK1723891.1 hypothetical protein [Thiocystis violacea]